MKFCKFFIIYPSSFDPEIHLLELSSLPSIYSTRGGGSGGRGREGEDIFHYLSADDRKEKEKFQKYANELC